MTELIYPELSYVVQGSLFVVNDALRHLNLTESGWERAIQIVLADQGIAADRQVEFQLHYKGCRVGRFFVDMIVDNAILVEVKAKESLAAIDVAQVITYLKVTGLKLGILANLGGHRVQFRRIPNRISHRPPGGAPLLHGDDLQSSGLIGELCAAVAEVHETLRPGFMHMHYRRACQVELRERGMAFRVQKEVEIKFRGRPIETRTTRMLIVEDKVAVIPLAVSQITAEHRGRFRYYLQLLNLKTGLISNHHTARLAIEMIQA